MINAIVGFGLSIAILVLFSILAGSLLSSACAARFTDKDI